VRLYKLELYGFKSFADKTEFVFDDGLTVFCGPNGCGKSNIVDAVRWVLGEQSAKSLRGGEMADVIFNGTAARKSLGFAEASLTILNDRKLLPVDYEEVRVTRRLYRSGDSEYMINMQPCRLKDIRELFMDTGVGMDAYSVMEQGKIDALLQSNPAERRTVFEEAAGISKYKAKKKAATAKLERVEQNLLRLGDIVEEVEKQLRSVKRQASAARRYKEAADELNERKLQLALHRYHELEGGAKVVEDEIRQGRDKVQQLRSALETTEASQSELETEAVDLDRQIARVESADAEFHSQIAAAEEAVNLNRQRMQEQVLAESKYTSEINTLSGRIADTERELERSEQETVRIDEELVSETEKLHEQQEAIKAITEECSLLAQDVERQRVVLMDVMRSASALQNRLSSLDAERKSLGAQSQRIEERVSQRRSDLEKVEQRIAAGLGEIEALENTLEQLNEELQEKQSLRNTLKTRVEELGEQIGEKRNVLAARESRRQMLEDLEQKHEGLNQGVVDILKQMESGDVAGVKGMVADLMQADLEYAAALEAALGDSAQHLVTESVYHSLQGIDYLKQNKKGRATFRPLDRLQAVSHHELPETNGCFVGRAHELIDCPSDCRALFDMLLHNTLIVRDIHGAVGMSSNGFRNFRLVTLDGDIIEPSGAITGGTNQGRMGVISRKSELRAITSEIEQIQHELDALQEEYRQRASERDELETQIDDLRNRIHASTVDLAEKRKEHTRLADDRQRFTDEIEACARELDEIAQNLKHVGEQETELAAQLDELSSKEQAARTEIDTMEQRRKEKDAQRAKLDSQTTERRVFIAQQRQRSESLKFAVERYRRNIDEQKAAIERDKNEIELCRERRKESAELIEKKQEEINRLIAERENLRQSITELRNRRAELDEKLTAAQGTLKNLRREIEQSEQALHQFELKLNETTLRKDSLAENVREQHSVEIAERYNDYTEDESADWDAVRAQLEDLNSAKNSLTDVIRKINKTSREMFEQTFNSVRGHFNVVFRKLFGGGKADIILEEEKDVLEAGIEIIARPPGKEPRSISLLSGGEKSLTAVALLFAIFKAKPSPFCILDEVDAALDESNTERFVGMIREYQKDSQFIIITHSRRTMAAADTIYGITMQETGVSRKVSIKFEDIEEEETEPAAQEVA